MLERIRRNFGLRPHAKVGGTLAAPPPWLFDSLGAVDGGEAGVTISPEIALHSPAVYAAVKAIAESIAMLPLRLYRRGPDGQRDRVHDHALAHLLAEEPNSVQTAFDFRLGLQTEALLRGNAFAYVHRAQDNTVAELIPIPPGAVMVEYDADNLPFYRVTMADGAQRAFSRDDVLHIKTLSARDPYTGESPVRLAAAAIALDIVMTRHAGALFGRGVRPSGVLQTDQAMNEETIKRLRDQFQELYSGLSGAGKTLVLEQGMQWQQISMSSVDAQLLELRRHQVAEIARVYRVPLPLVQDLERTTHNNAEEMSRQFLQYTLLPWLRTWEQALNRTLLSSAERGEYYFEFDPSGFVRADIAARFSAYQQAVTNGFLSPNEVRELENRPPYPGGDTFWRPLNLEAANQQLEAQVVEMDRHLTSNPAPAARRSNYGGSNVS